MISFDPVLEEVTTSKSTSSFSGLDPILSSLGVLVGLLKSEGDDSYSLISEWFTDPYTYTKAGIVKNPKEFTNLFSELFGEIGGNALGIPIQNSGVLGTWYPIKYSKDGEDVNTGVNIVTYQKDTSTVIGLGVYHAWEFGDPVTIQSSIWGLIPFVAIDPEDAEDPVKITFVSQGYPIVFGAGVNGPDPTNPIIQINGIEFNGVKVNANIDLAKAVAGTSPFELGVEIIGLQLAGENQPSNRSLSDLEAITAEQIMNTAASLFVGGLSKVFPDLEENIKYFPPLFGFSPDVPKAEGAPNAILPVLKWYDLFAAAQNNNADAIFLDWFNSIASDNNTFKTWLSCFSGFLFNDPSVSGDGSRNSPFLISLLNVSEIGTISLAFGTDVVGESTRILYPGLAFKSTAISLGGSDINFVMQADAELAKFQITGNSIGLAPTINFTTKFNLVNKTGSDPLAEFDLESTKYSIGSLEGGMSLGTEATMMPWFGLNTVDIGNTHYNTLDLLSPGQLAQAGAAALSEGLQSLLNFGTGNEKLSDSIGAIIGLQPPAQAENNWPNDLVAPFSAEGMISSITNPIGSWADYYAKVLTYGQQIEGKAAFAYIVESFAQLLQVATETSPIVLTGTGEQDNPWKAGISTTDITLPAYLTCYQENIQDTVVLNIGVELAPELTIGDTEIIASLELDAATITFPKTGSFDTVTADWLSNVGVRLSLPNGYETPEVGGMQVKVSSSQLSATWSQQNFWSWSMFVNGPALVVDGETTALGTDLNFDDQSSLQDLVTQTASTFGPFLVSALGTMLIRTQSRAALFVAGAMGFVKDIANSPIFPTSGLTWTGFELYPFTSFTDPWLDLNNQIDQAFATDEKGKSILGLLAYTMTDVNIAPIIEGAGTFDQPWITPIPLGFNLPVWYTKEQQNLGMGFGRNQLFNYPSTGTTEIQFDLDLKLNIVEYSTKDQKIEFINNAPSLYFIGTISKPSGKLVDMGSIGSIDEIQLGFSLSLKDGNVVFNPVINLVNAQLGTDFQSALVTIDDYLSTDFASNLQSSFLALINGAIQVATSQESVTEDSGFQTAYQLFEILGLALNRENNSAPYGINTGGWNGLLASPTSYMSTQLLSLLKDPENRVELFDFLQQITGITVPSLPKPALQFLSAIEICGAASDGYPLLPDAILEVFTNPVQGLITRFQNFFTDADAVRTLSAQIASNLDPVDYGNITFSTTANGLITFAMLPKNGINIGGFATLFGSIELNISNETLTFTGDIYIPKVGFTLATTLGLRMDKGTFLTPDFAVRVIWGDGQKPSAASLGLYPFDSNIFVQEVADLAPAYTLNVLLNAIFEDELLSKYELIQKIFTGLGIGQDEDNIWSMPSLMGILSDPLDWILSNEVLGTDGKFSIPKLITLLGELPEVEYNGMKVTPTPGKGMEMSGLPFGFKMDMNGEDGLATFDFGVDTISIVNNLASLKNLNFGVTLNEDYQPAFSGGLDIEATISSLEDGFFTHLRYDKGFQLSLSQGTVLEPTGLGVQLLPFQGWGTIAGEALATGAAMVINDLAPKLMNYLLETYPAETTDAGKFFAAMNSFAIQTDVNELMTNIIHVFNTGINSGKNGEELLKDLEEVAFAWVKERFSITGAPDTAQAIVDLLKLALPPESLSVIGGKIQYIPSASLPFKLLAGLDNTNAIGLWAGVELPEMELLKMQFSPTGVAYNLDTSSLDITFGLDLMVPIEGLNGPALHLSFEANTFNFSFDPLADPNNLSTPSPLNVELLPNFFGGGDISNKVTTWLLNVIKDVLPRYVSLLILNNDHVKPWLETPLITSSTITPVALLEATQVVQDTEGTYFLRSFDELAQITPTEFLGSFLYTLLNQQWTLLTFGEKGKISIGPKTYDEGKFGLLVQAPGLTIEAIPNLVFQIGAENSEWISKSMNGTPSFGDAGIGFYIPIQDNGGGKYSVDFTLFNLVLNNVGFDLIGKNGQPIVNYSNFKLGTVDPRALFDMQFQGDEPIKMQFGAGLTFDQMGISLAPESISEGGGNNPVAKNVLGSGEKDGDNSDTDPQFSVDIGYIDKLWVNLRSNTGNGTEVIVPVQRSFGPLYIESVGVGWEGEKNPPILDFISSGSLELAGFKASLQGLKVGVPVTQPTDWNAYTIDLDGFAIDYSGGVNINAGFLKDEIDGIVNYTGVAILSSAKFSLGALGSYAQIDMGDGETATSMFIFGVLNAPLGGVPAFFITGIAAGFAYNRTLDIPSIENVANFPLVKGVAEGSFTEGEDPMQALLQLNDVIRPQVGQYWFAAGLKFTSFGLLETTALLFLSFGKDLEFNLLGVSTATLPPKVSTNLALAYMELAIKVTINPIVGYVSAEAQLTPNSFVLARDVKITGGFAFYLWFKDIPLEDGGKIPAGDFVVTLGGYHPAFNKPSYYPDVPRLGINWKLDFSVGQVAITGGAYFAICPTAIMAGGYLTIAFNAGPLIAGLDAYANFLIEWNPFYFNVAIGVTVFAGFETTIAGVSVRLVAKLGCTLELKGPPVYGKVEVDWYVISFSIPIGNQDNNPSKENLDWAGFEEAFLPSPSSSTESIQSNQNDALVKVSANDSEEKEIQEVVKWTAQIGLEQDNNDGSEGDSSNEWTIQPIPWQLTVESAIPISTLTVASSDTLLGGSSEIGVRPMGKEDELISPMTVKLTDEAGNEINLKERNISLTSSNNGAPSALWARTELNREIAPDPTTMIISSALFGLTINASQYVYRTVIPEFSLSNLEYVEGDTKRLAYDFTPKYPAAELYPNAYQSIAYTMIKQTIMEDSVISKRNSIYKALQLSNINAPLNPDLSVMASSANLILQDFPVLARVGIYQNGGEVEPGQFIRFTTNVVQSSAIESPNLYAPLLQAQLQSYKVRGGSAKKENGIPVISSKARGQWKTTNKVAKENSLIDAANYVGTSAKTLYDGTTFIWKTDPKMNLILEQEGSLPSLIASFDEYGSLLNLNYYDNSGTYDLHSKIGQVVIHGYKTNLDSTVGWQINMNLSKINGTWALANGCLIRVQNSRQIKPRKGQIGHVKASELIALNTVKTKGNVIRKGWIQTVFSRQCKVFGILVAGDVNPNALQVSITANEVPTKAGKTIATSIQHYEGNTLLLFEAPTKTETFYGAIISFIDQETEILGMYASNCKVSKLINDLNLIEGGIDFKDDLHESSSVKLIQKK